MYKLILFFLLNPISFIAIFPQPVKAFNTTLTNNGNSANYDDNYHNSGHIGFNNWQVNSQNLLTNTGWFYRLNNAGEAQNLDTLGEGSATINSNSATLPYTGNDFTLNLDLSLDNNGSTLNQTATVNNTGNSDLSFDLYFYGELNTSVGNSGDTVVINSTNYTATQSGDLNPIITTITENNTNYIGRSTEADAIDSTNDTLINKLQFPSSGNTPSLSGTLNAASAQYSVSFAYQWNYNLAAGESFQIGINHNAQAVPLEFSPGLGLLLSGILVSIKKSRRYLKLRSQKF
jgi:hypothetical protein